ncbi:hypothetical protein [Wolbachia endosymbiont (group B) of Colias croceus]|uniref:hypothetical protein n=1 Tax=Wolbachia endosymbiont (group B) of Colias croceus TaxID=2953998 RepID=UPI00222665FA|nr:hypothetical protein [Wolbachia endosymbiont (group B) of Colias croceus]
MIQKIIVDFYAIREQWKHATFNLCKIIKTIEEKNDTLYQVPLVIKQMKKSSFCL